MFNVKIMSALLLIKWDRQKVLQDNVENKNALQSYTP